jgi:peptidoglycan/LPS O-acetylase OafA/YrhL
MTTPQPHLSHPKYRPDIDGLRAIAVLFVVAFHAFPGWLRGGFVGVDIFFVISGFLISTIILENLDKGTFSFSEFYARRIKRIFPALIVVLIACYTFGWFALLAEEYKHLGKHIAAGAGFLSNFALWQEAGYFDPTAETKPLLHLWSLGIEEQFYIVWPLLLWVAWRGKFDLLTITLFVASISFVLNLERIRTDKVGTFYFPHTRFWELVCGGVLAWLRLYKKEACQSTKSKVRGWVDSAIDLVKSAGERKVLSNCLSFAGFFLLAYSAWKIREEYRFPGKWAVIPVLGAVSIIAAGPNAWANRIILSNKVAVWFGLISYPLYLWHWPLLSFAHVVQGEMPSRTIRITAVALSIVLAWLTYKLIELPIRSGRYRKGAAAVLFLLMTVVGCVGYSTYSRDGLGFRENATLKEFAGDIGQLDFHKYMAERYFVCTPESIAKEALKWEGFVRCMQSKSGPDVDIALVGDSHAEHLFLGLAEALPAKNVAFYIKGGVPFLDNPEFEKIFATVLASKTIKGVVLAMAWDRAELLVREGSRADNRDALYENLINVVDALSKAGKRVYLADDIPTFDFGPEKGNRWLATTSPSWEISVEKFEYQRDVYVGALNRVVQSRPDVRILNFGKYLCNDRVCRMNKGNEIIYRDNNHVNIIGSLYIGKRLVEDNPGIFD